MPGIENKPQPTAPGIRLPKGSELDRLQVDHAARLRKLRSARDVN